MDPLGVFSAPAGSTSEFGSPSASLTKKSKLYTRTGDKGETSLLGGIRVSKTDPRIEAVGALDECNAALGVALTFLSISVDPDDYLPHLQHVLFEIGASVAAPSLSKETFPAQHVKELEHIIDVLDSQVPPLTAFILPGGASVSAGLTRPLAAHLHLVRTVVRRCERALVAVGDIDKNVLVFMNRLSDFFFVAARWYNMKHGVPEVKWSSRV